MTEERQKCVTYRKALADKYEYDLVVCGGGMSGVATAVSAARAGVPTLLIERTGCLGGTATNGGVNHFLGGKKYVETKGALQKCVGGLFDEICNRMVEAGAAIDPHTVDFSLNPHGWLASLGEGPVFDSEYLKRLLEQLCEEAGVKLLYYTDIVDALCSERQINRLVVHNKSGLFSVKGKYFADTTADGDIAFLSGCEVKLGREDDGLMAPSTLEMQVEGVDTKRLSEYIAENKAYRFKKEVEQLRKNGIWDFPVDIFISVQLVKNDVYMINTLRQVGIDGTDGESLTEGTVDGRRQSFRLFEIIKKHIAGFENASIRAIAPVIGIRETRRIVGEYTLTVADLTANRNFKDTVALSGYGWDLPDPKAPSFQPMHGISKPEFTPIPYGCLVPKGCDNLIVAGRCISVERDVLGIVREMAPCVAMGQAAGLAAAQAVSALCSFKDINTEKLQSDICAAGGIVSLEGVQERKIEIKGEV